MEPRDILNTKRSWREEAREPETNEVEGKPKDCGVLEAK